MASEKRQLELSRVLEDKLIQSFRQIHALKRELSQCREVTLEKAARIADDRMLSHTDENIYKEIETIAQLIRKEI